MKNVIISGANGNLGQAVVNKLLSSGYYVAAIVRSEAAKTSLPDHPHLLVYIADLSDENSTNVVADQLLATLSRIDAVLMLAGGFAAGNLEATGSDEIKQQVALNFDTAYHLTRRIFPQMVKQEYGRLVYIGARPALSAEAGKHLMAYGLAKSLLFKLAEYLNAEGKDKNVTATVVVPSTIDTPDNRKAMPKADAGKWVKPEALADILELIISDKGEPLREVVLKVYNKS